MLTREEARRILTVACVPVIDEGVEVMLQQSMALDFDYFNELYMLAYREDKNERRHDTGRNNGAFEEANRSN